MPVSSRITVQFITDCKPHLSSVNCPQELNTIFWVKRIVVLICYLRTAAKQQLCTWPVKKSSLEVIILLPQVFKFRISLETSIVPINPCSCQVVFFQTISIIILRCCILENIVNTPLPFTVHSVTK